MRIFKLYPVLDAKDFASYALRTIAQALQVDSGDQEYQGTQKKIHVICKALSKSTDKAVYYHSLQFNAAMIGSVLPLNKTLTSYEVKDIAAACKASIEATLSLSPSTVFLGAAAARAEIWSQYQNMECAPKCYSSSYGDSCFHERHAQLLRRLTERSREEARCNILLASNARLPVRKVTVRERIPTDRCLPEFATTAVLSLATDIGETWIHHQRTIANPTCYLQVELVDHIFDYLLLAEAVPLEPAFSKSTAYIGVGFEIALEQYSCQREIRVWGEEHHSKDKLQRMYHHYCRDDEEASDGDDDETAICNWMLY